MADQTTSTATDERSAAEQRPSGEGRPTGAAPGSEASAQQDLDSLRQRVASAEQQRDEYLNLLQRTRADFENYQKRIQRDLNDERRSTQAAFARELLPVLDNLQRAVGAARTRAELAALLQGVDMVQSQMLDIFRRFGITPIDALGLAFDPNVHQAVTQQVRDDVDQPVVSEVLEPGYRLHDRVLRPARVAVAMPAQREAAGSAR